MKPKRQVVSKQLSDEMSVRGLYYDGLVRRCYHSFPEAKFVFAHPFIANPAAQIVKNHLIGQYSDSKAYSFRNIGQMFLLYNSVMFMISSNLS